MQINYNPKTAPGHTQPSWISFFFFFNLFKKKQNYGNFDIKKKLHVYMTFFFFYLNN